MSQEHNVYGELYMFRRHYVWLLMPVNIIVTGSLWHSGNFVLCYL